MFSSFFSCFMSSMFWNPIPPTFCTLLFDLYVPQSPQSSPSIYASLLYPSPSIVIIVNLFVFCILAFDSYKLSTLIWWNSQVYNNWLYALSNFFISQEYIYLLYSYILIIPVCILTGHRNRFGGANCIDRRVDASASHDGHLWHPDTDASWGKLIFSSFIKYII